jgi:poly-gamma-glutamate system protein
VRIGLLLLLLLSGSLAQLSAEISQRRIERAERAWNRASGWVLATRRASESWDPELDPNLSGLIGSCDGIYTSTLGHLESKQCAARAEWCQVIAQLLDSLGIDSRDTVAVTMTGSFPGLNLAVLLTLEAGKIPYRCVSSLGASSYGANEVDFNWPSMEAELRERGMLESGSTLVTPGGSGDRMSSSLLESLDAAEGLLRELAVSRHPGSLRQGVELRQRAMGVPEHLSLLINVGGGHAVLGSTAFARNAGTGLLGDQARLALAMPESHEGIKGLMQIYFEYGMPVLHFSGILELAKSWGIDCEHDGEVPVEDIQ